MGQRPLTPSVLEEVDDRAEVAEEVDLFGGGEAVGVYASFHEADEDERKMIEEEEAAQPPLSLDAQLEVTPPLLETRSTRTRARRLTRRQWRRRVRRRRR